MWGENSWSTVFTLSPSVTTTSIYLLPSYSQRSHSDSAIMGPDLGPYQPQKKPPSDPDKIHIFLPSTSHSGPPATQTPSILPHWLPKPGHFCHRPCAMLLSYHLTFHCIWRVCLDFQPNHQQQPQLTPSLFQINSVSSWNKVDVPLSLDKIIYSFQRHHSFELSSLTSLAYDLTFIYSTTIYWDLIMSQRIRHAICFLTSSLFLSSCFHSSVAPANLPRSAAFKHFWSQELLLS